MKRGQMGEADKHAIRRKIEEKQVMVREQRKVRERLSRECADTMFHIASTESVIKSIAAKHKELLENKAEDFKYSTAADRREVQQLEEKCAELERIVTSSDVVEREQKVLTARLAALRLDDNKEEVANAREMDALKRNLFNARNDLENVFRTTLHDLNVTYQDQAFDAMVQEATTAKGELPALRRDLRAKTKIVNRVIAKQSRSLTGAGCAKVERDLTDEFVKLQAKREKKLRRTLASQREVIQREREGLKDLGEELETFQKEAVELRVAAGQLRQFRAESARVREECLQARAWAHTLAKKGPKALKAELRRRRLAALTAASVASFKANTVDSAQSRVASGGSYGDHNGDHDGDSDVDRTPVRSIGSRKHLGIPGSGSTIDGERTSAACYSDGKQGGGADADAGPALERRDTCILVAGMEVGGLGASVGITNTCIVDEADVPGRHLGHHGEGVGAPRSSTENASERIWRASLSGFDSTRNNRNIGHCKAAKTNSDISGGGGDTQRADATTAASGSDSDGPSSTRNNSSASLPAASEAHQRRQIRQASPSREGRETSDAAASTTALLGANKESNATSTSPRGTDRVAPSSVGLDKLPPEVLASMLLLSEHDFVGGKMSASDVLDRARQWEQQRNVNPSQPFPDLPYSFTDLGRRVNVEK